MSETGLPDAVDRAFRAGGPLAAAIEGFHPRVGQLRMAAAVAETVQAGGALVVEAATGVGKTFAYLVPALLSGERVLLSTATKTLQEQLFHRDLPRLAAALELPVRKALLKGRSSYLCLHRLELAAHDDAVRAPREREQLARIQRWAQGTSSGDLAELPWLDERSPLMPLVTSTRENCLGADCPQFRACHVNLARREALAADVVVINHHLFFADLAIRESGMAELLPAVRCVVFDEAHKLNEIGLQFLGQQLGSAQLINLAHDALVAGLQHARGLFDWRALATSLERAARDLRLAFGRRDQAARLRWVGAAPEGIAERRWAELLEEIGQTLAAAIREFEAADDLAADFGRLRERAARLAALVRRFSQPRDATQVRWADVRGGVRLVEAPLDIAEVVRARLLAPEASATGRERAWVFVSATLGDDDRLTWFTAPCGLEDARVLRIESPFDYAHQAALYVAADFPRPGDASHADAVARLAASAAARLGGRTLVLTTTLRALARVGAMLPELLGAGSEIEVLVQGQGPKRALIARFRAAVESGARGCVMVASASFWEGLDVPGDALQLVIIDKLPFPPPADPLVEARCQRAEAEGHQPFKSYFMPAAAVALKQGAGRLIRTESDRGILIVCDPRLTTMGYGRRLLAALPPMRRLATRQELDAALAQLAVPRVD